MRSTKGVRAARRGEVKHNGRDKTHGDREGQDTEEERNKSGGKRSTRHSEMGNGCTELTRLGVRKVGMFNFVIGVYARIRADFVSVFVCLCVCSWLCLLRWPSSTLCHASRRVRAHRRFPVASCFSADPAPSCDWLQPSSIWGCFQLHSHHPVSSLQQTPSLNFQSSYRRRWRTSAHEMHSSHFQCHDFARVLLQRGLVVEKSLGDLIYGARCVNLEQQA